jgi:hypothetical protein
MRAGAGDRNRGSETEARLNTLSRSPTSTATWLTLAPSNANTSALYRCSTTDIATNANPGLPAADPTTRPADHGHYQAPAEAPA